MKIRAGVLGDPIAHSLSPLIHNTLYKALDIEGEYSRFQVSEAQFSSFLGSHSPEDWSGFSLTMPLKEIALTHVTRIDPIAQRAQAINTLIPVDGRWHGYNTDVIGFEKLLGDVDARSISILGAGGTARAALVALGTQEKVSIYRRSQHRDPSLRGINPSITIKNWSDYQEAFADDLVINTVPELREVAIDRDSIRTRAIIDALYAPWPTALSTLAERFGIHFQSGIDLLLSQALPQFTLMTGIGEIPPNVIEGISSMLREKVGIPHPH